MLKKIIDFFTKPRGFLCDRCVFDYDRACKNPKRPNATECKDFKKRY